MCINFLIYSSATIFFFILLVWIEGNMVGLGYYSWKQVIGWNGLGLFVTIGAIYIFPVAGAIVGLIWIFASIEISGFDEPGYMQ